MARVLSVEELNELVDGRDLDACVLDFETNGFNASDSVLSCSAIRYRVDSAARSVALYSAVARYYYATEPLNPYAIAVNGLDEAEVTRRRGGAEYPRQFRDDAEMRRFIRAADIIVCHNASFDLRFLRTGAAALAFCTMRASTPVVRLRRSSGGWKFPSLQEAALHYRVDMSCARAHESLCDACVTAMVFDRMLSRAADDSRRASSPKSCEALAPAAASRAPSRRQSRL